MTRSAITGAKQHRLFQEQGLSRILDFKDVKPLFKLPSATLIYEEDTKTTGKIPTKSYYGRFERHELPLSVAKHNLVSSDTETEFVDSEIRSSYHTYFSQGANLTPRRLCFVQPERHANSPAVKTDDDFNKGSFNDVTVSGIVSDQYLFAAVINQFFVPFGLQKFKLAALPVRLDQFNRYKVLLSRADFRDEGNLRDYRTWFSEVQEHWSKAKGRDAPTLASNFNDYRKLENQSADNYFQIIYNASGKNLASFVLDVSSADLEVYERPVSGIVVDSSCYHYVPNTIDEAHYLCALLNSNTVDKLIKPYQPEGAFGPRHVHRTPFEACSIPEFFSDDQDHIDLANLSKTAHRKIAEMQRMKDPRLERNVTTARKRAREIVANELDAIDEIAMRILPEITDSLAP